MASSYFGSCCGSCPFLFYWSFFKKDIVREIEAIDLNKTKTRIFSDRTDFSPALSALSENDKIKEARKPLPKASAPVLPQKTLGSPDTFLLANAHLWSYKGDTGPAKWPELNPSFSECGKKDNQSPIDLRPAVLSSQIPKIDFFLGPRSLKVAHQSALVMLFPASRPQSFHGLHLDGDRYGFEYALLHSPGEHLISGVSYDAELQLVFKNSQGLTAIMAVLFEETLEKSVGLDGLLQALPRKNEVDKEIGTFDFELILPASLKGGSAFYYYPKGSLSVPPCSPDVQWFVLREPQPISAKQVDSLAKKVGFNKRPVQARAGRRVLVSP